MITANIIWNEKKLGPIADLMVDIDYFPLKTWVGWTPDNRKDLLTGIFKSIRQSNKFF